MMYNANLLIEELFKRNFKNKKIIRAYSTRKPLERIDTNTINQREGNTSKILLTSTGEKYRAIPRKTKMLFNEVIYNSTRNFYDVKAKPIEKRVLSAYTDDNFMKFKIRKKELSSLLSFKNKAPKRETPYEMNRDKRNAFKSLIDEKIRMNTTSNLNNEMIKPTLTSKKYKITQKKGKRNTKGNLYIKPCLYFNKLMLSKHEQMVKKINGDHF